MSVNCEGRVLGPLIKTIGLETIVGHPETRALGGLPWPNPFFGFVGFYGRQNVDITYEHGHMYLTPAQNEYNTAPSIDRYEHTVWVDTGEFSADLNVTTPGFEDVPPEYGQNFFDLTGAEIVFRFVPMINDFEGLNVFDAWYGSFQVYDFGEAPGSGDVSPFPFSWILLEWLGDDGPNGEDRISLILNDNFDTDEQIYLDFTDPDKYHWWRIAHDDHTGEVVIQSAPKGCAPYPSPDPRVWQTQLSSVGAWQNRLTSFTIEATWDMNSDDGHSIHPGMISVLGQTPTDRVLPLFTRVGAARKTLGPVRKTLDLFTNVGGV